MRLPIQTVPATAFRIAGSQFISQGIAPSNCDAYGQFRCEPDGALYTSARGSGDDCLAASADAVNDAESFCGGPTYDFGLIDCQCN